MVVQASVAQNFLKRPILATIYNHYCSYVPLFKQPVPTEIGTNMGIAKLHLQATKFDSSKKPDEAPSEAPIRARRNYQRIANTSMATLLLVVTCINIYFQFW